MSLNSIEFLIFFLLVTTMYFVIPRKIRHIWLLMASYCFYMTWNKKYTLLLLFVTIITYGGGLLIEHFNDNEKKRKHIVAITIILNLAVLAFFKYGQFLLNNINSILDAVGKQHIDYVWKLALPIGISFYMFQALGYVIDVYRKDINAERNFLKYALFVSFFPQIVSGPIGRAGSLLTQINNIQKNSRPEYKRIINGFIVMLWGLFIKAVIADRVALLVNQIFDYYYLYGTVELIIGAICYALQIYCDFVGYSTIAVGAAQVMGFELIENFKAPYFATSVKDFWRRWHISLSSWLRDYVYIPLGGNRCSKPRKWWNIFVTFMVSGIWHGANWTFIVWGVLHGLFQIIGELTANIRNRFNIKLHTKEDSFSFRLGKIILTFLCVDTAWIFFRANSITDALLYIKRMASEFNPWVLYDKSLYNIALDTTEIHILILSVIALFLVDLIREKRGLRIDQYLEQQCLWFRWLIIFALIYSVVVYGIYGPNFDSSQFIYLQF